ncbi:MAG: 5-formyltetrahydrofolate cyclo-ligase [Lachnospiraceae bacterium]|nr:5-formyltetrahydrofolate cyclo-ligase [Lachnospiraceae bacterium]
MDKATIRTQIKQRKRQLSKEEILELSHACIKSLMELDCISNYDIICPYVSYNQEVATWDFIKQLLKEGKKVAVPKVIGDEMEFFYIHQFSDLLPGAYGILEPSSGQTLQEPKALVIMPGLAFDKEKNRIGYGGGFYDKYLEKHPDFLKVALAYDFQIYEKLDVEQFDIKPDIIVTDKRVIG